MGYGKTYVIGSFNACNLSEKRASSEFALQIYNLIRHEGIDLLAMQEVLSGGKPLSRIMGLLGRDWDKVWLKIPGGNNKDSREEGYAFIWNKQRLKKVDTVLKGGQKRVYEPRIFNQYKVDRNIGEKELVRNPLYGRFTPRDLGGGNCEIRIICTHIRYNGTKEKWDPSFWKMRQNEFNILTRVLYPKLEDRIYGDMMPAYTILMGDYNMNLKRNWTKPPYINQPEEGIVLIDGPNMKRIITVQDQLTTLKQPKENNPDLNIRGYANNYDHFSYDEVRLKSLNPRCRRVDVIGKKFYDRYFGDFDKYRKEISDHIPIIIRLTPNENDLQGGDR